MFSLNTPFITGLYTICIQSFLPQKRGLKGGERFLGCFHFVRIIFSALNGRLCGVPVTTAQQGRSGPTYFTASLSFSVQDPSAQLSAAETSVLVADAQPNFFTIAESVALMASCGRRADTASAMALIGASPVMPAPSTRFAVRSVRSPPSVSALRDRAVEVGDADRQPARPQSERAGGVRRAVGGGVGSSPM